MSTVSRTFFGLIIILTTPYIECATIFPFGSAWAYNVSGASMSGDGWNNVGYPATYWPIGTAPFGYSINAGINTALSPGPSMYYFLQVLALQTLSFLLLFAPQSNITHAAFLYAEFHNRTGGGYRYHSHADLCCGGWRRHLRQWPTYCVYKRPRCHVYVVNIAKHSVLSECVSGDHQQRQQPQCRCCCGCSVSRL